MSEDLLEGYAARVRSVAAAFAYPPTPRISHAPGVPGPRPAPSALRRAPSWLVVAFLAVAMTMIAVPQARAGVIRMIRIGAVRLLFAEPSPTASPSTETAVATSSSSPRPRATQTRPSAGPSVLQGLSGETTLESARAGVPFSVLLPSYPPDLGPPDRVFVQEQGGPIVLLAWVDPETQEVRLLLQELASESWGLKKIDLEQVTTTSVGGEPAVWTTGPYVLVFPNGAQIQQRIVGGHSLIWQQGVVTFRLETSLGLEEAVHIAESLE